MQILTRTGLGSELNLTWNGQAPVLPGGAYHWTLTAPGATSTNRPLGTIRDWNASAHPASVGGGVVSGGAGSLQAVDGNVLTASSFTTDSRLPVTATQFDHAKTVGASIIPDAGGQPVTMELWNFATSQWVRLGTCPLVAGERCTLSIPASRGDVRAAGCRQRHHGDARPVQRRESDAGRADVVDRHGLTSTRSTSAEAWATPSTTSRPSPSTPSTMPSEPPDSAPFARTVRCAPARRTRRARSRRSGARSRAARRRAASPRSTGPPRSSAATSAGRGRRPAAAPPRRRR